MSSFYSPLELKEFGFKQCGENVLISRKTSIYGAGNISIGDHARIDDFCFLSGHITIGKHVHISAYTSLIAGDAGIILEDYTGVSSRSVIYAVTDDYSGAAMSNPTIPETYKKLYKGPVILRKHALVGTGCTILPGVELAEGTSVGAMSLINRSTEPWGLYFGIPARKQKERKKDLLELCEEFERQEA